MRWVLITAAIFGAFSVIIGAALRHLGDDMNMDSLQIALHYHQLHSVVLLAFGLYALNKPCSVGLIVPAGLFIAGIFLFSGSLYVSELFFMAGFNHPHAFGRHKSDCRMVFFDFGYKSFFLVIPLKTASGSRFLKNV